jgi:hypothetical protein
MLSESFRGHFRNRRGLIYREQLSHNDLRNKYTTTGGSISRESQPARDQPAHWRKERLGKSIVTRAKSKLWLCGVFSEQKSRRCEYWKVFDDALDDGGKVFEVRCEGTDCAARP